MVRQVELFVYTYLALFYEKALLHGRLKRFGERIMLLGPTSRAVCHFTYEEYEKKKQKTKK